MCYGETLSAAIVRARKQHECTVCGRDIHPGQRYARQAGTFEGEFYANKVCRTCYLAEDRANDGEECFYYSDGETRDALRWEPWRETLAWMRKAWATARGRVR